MTAKKSISLYIALSLSARLFRILDRVEAVGRAICISRRECNDGMRADYRIKCNVISPMPGRSVCNGRAEEMGYLGIQVCYVAK